MDSVKISFIGDIMSEPCLLSQVHDEKGYDYAPVFSPLKRLFKDSDYLIGNLETPVAGEAFGYSDSLFSFNAPESLLTALKDIGVDMLSTANNHTLDRDYRGLVETIDNLDKAGITHTGTYKLEDNVERIHYFKLGETVFAVIAYTYSTNYRLHHRFLDDQHQGCINYLMPYNAPNIAKPAPKEFDDVKNLFKEFSGRELSREESTKLKVAMKIPVAYADDVFDRASVDHCLEKVRSDYTEARKNADLVFFYPHMGGQFNVEVGALSNYVMDRCSRMGFDAIVNNHPHTTQKAVIMNNIPCFFSLGNVSQSPISVYAVRETLPEYGLAAHFYVTDKKFTKITFSVFKILESDKTPMRIIPVADLFPLLDEEEKGSLAGEVSVIYSRITGKKLSDNIIRDEYDLF